MHTGIYLRISQDKTGEAAGVTRQREDCIELVDQLGWQVAEIYQDNDVSATSTKPRPEYRRMLADIESGRIGAIAVWHPDRLYRRMTDLEELVDLCERHTLLVRTVRAGDFDLSTPTGKMIARILAATAQGEVEAKADRWLRSYRQRRESGQWMAAGPRTFGYTRKGELVDDEAAIIRDAATALLGGEGMMSVCNRLRADGILTTRNNPWTPTALRLLLVNPRIAGLATLKGEVIGPGSWEPLLDRATWEQVRALLSERRVTNGSGGAHPRSLLHGLAVCGHREGDDICGRLLVRSTTSVPVYQCRIAGTWSSQHVTVSAARVEELVEAYARERLADDRVRSAILIRVRPGVPDVMLREIEDYETELADLRETLKTARHAATKADIVTEMDRVRDEITDRRARLVPLPDVPVSGDEWPDDLARRSRLIRLVVARVVVGPATTRGRFDPSRIVVDPV